MPRLPLERAREVQVHPEAYAKGMPIVVPLVRCIDDVANVLAWDGRWTQGTQIEKAMGWTCYGVGATTNFSRYSVYYLSLSSHTRSAYLLFATLQLSAMED